jgi:formin-binding protein 1
VASHKSFPVCAHMDTLLISDTEGSIVSVLEPDDGSGWVKVANDRRQDGLVPASYIQTQAQTGGPQSGVPPSPNPRSTGGSGQYGAFEL